MDRRAAQSVPNIFFKHKKLQMKQISDKVNLAIRRCKNKGKKIQQLKLESQHIWTNLLNLMKAITLLFGSKKKGHFCNDKTAFFAHLVYVIVSS